MKKKIVIALGGNALLQRGEVLSAENQQRSIQLFARMAAELARDYQLVIVHGNGPQVGLLALQNAAYQESPAWPLDIFIDNRFDSPVTVRIGNHRDPAAAAANHQMTGIHQRLNGRAINNI